MSLENRKTSLLIALLTDSKKEKSLTKVVSYEGANFIVANYRKKNLSEEFIESVKDVQLEKAKTIALVGEDDTKYHLIYGGNHRFFVRSEHGLSFDFEEVKTQIIDKIFVVDDGETLVKLFKASQISENVRNEEDKNGKKSTVLALFEAKYFKGLDIVGQLARHCGVGKSTVSEYIKNLKKFEDNANFWGKLGVDYFQAGANGITFFAECSEERKELFLSMWASEQKKYIENNLGEIDFQTFFKDTKKLWEKKEILKETPKETKTGDKETKTGDKETKTGDKETTETPQEKKETGAPVKKYVLAIEIDKICKILDKIEGEEDLKEVYARVSGYFGK